MKYRNVIASLLLVALCVSCGGSDPAAGDRSRLGRDGAIDGGKRDKKKERRNHRANSAEERVQDALASGEAPGTGAAGASGSELEDADTPRSGIDPSLADASAHVDEPAPDAVKKGVPPQYSELNAVDLQGLGQTFRITLSFDGEVPERLPKDTFMVFGFAVSGRREGEGYAFGVNGTEEGWQPYSGYKGEARKFPGTFEIQGRDVVMVLPWSAVEGPRRFEWYANSSWFSQVAGQDMYAFDPVPNENAGRFPG
ncbi:MAG: hypothetical protein ACRDKT_09450 [Actinomycetota bacterium]